MKLFVASQIRELDQATIIHEPIASIDLMQRAAQTLFEAFLKHYDTGHTVHIFAGNGNNGGDALVLARMLLYLGSSFDVRVYVFKDGKRSDDCQLSLEELADDFLVHELESKADFPVISAEDVIVDGIFGTGLSRPVTHFPSQLIAYLNDSNAEIFSIDIPSGLFPEDNSKNDGAIVASDVIVSFQFPKIAFLLSDKSDFVGEWEVWDIGLHLPSIESMSSPLYLLEDVDLPALIKPRKKFSHKGSYGHALLIAGQVGMMGAAILSTKACIRSGAGLVSTHLPQHSGDLLQCTVPEALLSLDRSELMFTDEMDVGGYDVVGIGPGIGKRNNTQKALHHLLLHCNKPMVMDADALNILSDHKEWLPLLAQDTILTPHPKEFDRLTKVHHSAYERWQSQLAFAQQYGVVVVLKGAHTSVALPDGRCYFNTTGNAGMASGGVGDVLTGIILGLLSQGYSAEAAALLGVYWHGKAADVYAESHLEQTLTASDIVDFMSQVEF